MAKGGKSAALNDTLKNKYSNTLKYAKMRKRGLGYQYHPCLSHTNQ